jgi:hypothetical protein
MSGSEREAGGPTLACLGGSEPPPEMALGLKDLLHLSPGAKAHFWEALGPALPDPVPKELDGLLDRFQQAHEVPQGRLLRAIAACRMLLREAARRPTSADDFAQDVARLGGGAGEIAAILMPGFGAAMTALRQEILAATLSDHGKLLVGVDWRVDSMLLSNRGEKLQSPVAVVTLRYLEGGQPGRFTVQALPDMLQELQAMCSKILG